MSSEFLRFADLSDKARLNLIQTLVAAPGIDTDTNMQIISDAPVLQECQNLEAAKARLTEAHKIFFEEKGKLDRIFVELFQKEGAVGEHRATVSDVVESIAKAGDPAESTLILNKTEILFLGYRDRLIEPGKYDEAALAGAMAHYTVYIARKFYEQAQDEKVKAISQTFVIYFAAIEGLALGVQTNSQLQALNPNCKDLRIENGPAFVITYSDESESKKITTLGLFEGCIITQIPNINGEPGFVIHHPQGD